MYEVATYCIYFWGETFGSSFPAGRQMDTVSYFRYTNYGLVLIRLEEEEE